MSMEEKIKWGIRRTVEDIFLGVNMMQEKLVKDFGFGNIFCKKREHFV